MTLRSLCPRSRPGATRSRTWRFSSARSGKPPCALRDQMRLAGQPHLEDAADAGDQRHLAEVAGERGEQLLRGPRGAQQPAALGAVFDLQPGIPGRHAHEYAGNSRASRERADLASAHAVQQRAAFSPPSGGGRGAGMDDDAGMSRRRFALTLSATKRPRARCPGPFVLSGVSPFFEGDPEMLIDHRKLGRELDLFDSDPLIGAGLPFWLPGGAAARHEVESYLYELERRAGYRHVYSPALGKRQMFELSGHWQNFADDMFPPMRSLARRRLGDELVLRPSLCPHHALIFKSRQRSYRDLPLRIAELGPMYPGRTLRGARRPGPGARRSSSTTRTSSARSEQVGDEVAGVLRLMRRAHAALGLRPSAVRLSLRGEGGKYGGDDAMWDGPSGCCATRSTGYAVRGGARRGGLLRPEDRRADRRPGRAGVDPGHHPDRLPPAGAGSTCPMRRRTAAGSGR